MPNQSAPTPRADTAWVFVAICLLILTPIVHQALVIGYSLFNFDGLIILLGVSFFSVPLVLLARIRGNLSYTIIVGAVTSLLADYFLAKQPEVALWLAGVSLGVYVLLWKLGPKSAQIITTFAIAFVAADYTVAHTQVLRHVNGERSSSPIDSPIFRSTQPVIHLVFDAFQAPSALPIEQRETAKYVRSFFVNNGFRLYDNAFSRHNRTHQSLSAALNFDATPDSLNHLAPQVSNATAFEHSLGQNLVLTTATNAGLEAHLVQSAYMNFCPSTADAIVSECFTYSKNTLPRNMMLHLTLANRLEMLLLLVAQESFIFNYAKKQLNAVFNDIIPYVRSPLTSFTAHDITNNLIKTAKAETYIFTHSLISHSPYALDQNCLIQPVENWANDGGNKTSQQRKIAYQLYSHQIKCSLLQIAGILEKISQNPALKDALIIIHGDHASRLSRRRADFRAGDDLSTNDVLDNFPVLFAIKHPNTEPGISSVQVALDTLLAHHLGQMEVAPYTGVPDDYIYLLQANGELSKTSFDMKTMLDTRLK